MTTKDLLFFLSGILISKIGQDSLPTMDARPLIKKIIRIVGSWLFVIYAYFYATVHKDNDKNQAQVLGVLIAAIFILLAVHLSQKNLATNKSNELE